MLSEFKIIQTLVLPRIKSPITSSLGFISPEFAWMSWTLSCLQLKKYYNDVELYTNEAGKKVLIDTLKLPYTKVYILGDTEICPQSFSYHKLRTYSFQQDPFIHVDGDVFIWDRLTNTENKEQLISQNIECIDEHYRKIYTDLKRKGFKLPTIIDHEIQQGDPLISFNAGVIGGTDIAFFRDYCRQAMELFEVNADKINESTAVGFNFIIEQQLFYCLAKQKNKPVHCMIQKAVTDVTYFGYANFSEVPYHTKFIHLMGMYKKNASTCMSLAKRLRQDYPEYYYRVIAECQVAHIRMFLKYYNEEKSGPDGQSVNTNDIYWGKKYDAEKEQHLLAELVFSSFDRLSSCRFYTNDINKIRKANKNGEDTDYYVVPNSYTKGHTETEFDDLDDIITELLRDPKSFESLIKEIEPYFDENEVNDNREALTHLIKLKLHAGCCNNIYWIT